MSHPADRPRSHASGSVRGTQQELRRRGRVFGLEYDVGIRMRELSPETEPWRHALPGDPDGSEVPAPEEIGRWESEGGR